MVKKIDILGMWLDNYTVQEAMGRIDGYLEEHVLRAVESISIQMLMESEKDSVLRDVVDRLDLAMIEEIGILEAAGVSAAQRAQEIEENSFFVEFCKRMERNKKSVFLLGETGEKIEEMTEALKGEFPKLQLVGEYAIENCVGDLEAVINDMNAMTPDVIMSILPTPAQEHFFWEHREKMNASIWYGAGGTAIFKRKSGIKQFIQKRIQLTRLKSCMDKYDKYKEHIKSDGYLDEKQIK